MDKIPALRITQGNPEGEDGEVTIFVTAMTLAQLKNYTDVDSWGPDNLEGYQRPVVERRLREIAKYITEDRGVLPTSVLLGTRPAAEGTGPAIKLEGFSDNGGPVDSGYLVIPDGATLWVIDGQHRYSGVKFAYDRGMGENLDSYSFPVSVLWEIDQYSEMDHFNIINTTQKKMPTDIVDRHLVQRQAVQGLTKMVGAGAKQEKEYLRATATILIDRLNESPGVWQDQIAIPGIAGRDKGLVRSHAMVVSIEPFLRDSWVKTRSEDDKIKVLQNYWEAIKGVWPEAIGNPQEHRLQATAGIYSLHMALPAIIQRCVERGAVTSATMKAVLDEARLPSNFWHKEDGDPLTLGTGMASIRALSYYITEQLALAATSDVEI